MALFPMTCRMAAGTLAVIAAIAAARVAACAQAAPVTLSPCVARYGGLCGSISRPIDPRGESGGTISIGFELYRHTNPGPARGTIIAQEGGPGYATTNSRDGYVRLFTPLRGDRDILLIDKRGTGKSGAINCPRLQRGAARPLAATRACGERLGPSAWWYSTAAAADDVAAVLAALGTGAVDYYGDSYGTFFGQVFAVRHPGLLRSMVLDSAYPVHGENRFFPSEFANALHALDVTCARSPGCTTLNGGAPDLVRPLLARLRLAPLGGSAPGANGELLPVTADPGALFLVLALAGNSLVAYRDLNAAARAYLLAGDALPLLRLVAESQDGTGAGGYRGYSAGLAAAVSCTDYRQLYGMRALPAQRRVAYEAAIAAAAARNPLLYAPFSLDEALHAPFDPLALDQCITWPAAPDWAAPGEAVPPGAAFPAAPVLVLAGELDTATSPQEGRLAAQLFPQARYLLVRNAGHETAIGDEGLFVPPQGEDLAGCVGPIVRRFIASGGQAGDTSCAERVRPVRAVAVFAQHWAQTPPATPQAGNRAPAASLALASAAAETVGDALARYFVTQSGTGGGLRGGQFHLLPTANGYRLTLSALRWADDLAVSGRIDWNQQSGGISAAITLQAPPHQGSLRIDWNDRQSVAQADITGSIDGLRLHASRIAP